MTDIEYEAFERFAIQIESGVSEVDSLKYIQSVYGREIAVRLWMKYVKGKGNIA